MTTPISTTRPGDGHRSRSSILVALLAIAVVTIVAMAVVRWQGSSGGEVERAAPSMLMPAEAPASTDGGAPVGAGLSGTSGEQQVESDREDVPLRPSCETIAYPTFC
jgi:hypothetical protein